MPGSPKANECLKTSRGGVPEGQAKIAQPFKAGVEGPRSPKPRRDGRITVNANPSRHNSSEPSPVSIPGFGFVGPERIMAKDDLFLVAADKYPVSPGHTLLILKRPAARFSDLTHEEKTRLIHWLDWSIEHLQQTLQPKPDGFNIGTNDGAAAGQTIPQLHWHIIPRYAGDVPDPRGGVRFVIPYKARYWQDAGERIKAAK
jgi:diadenosine tetraphosphate (Ap4A) HIT family hydrolase